MKMERKAQSLIEYVMIVGAVAVLMITMTPFLKRSVQAMVKGVADQIGVQQNAEQANLREGDLTQGYVVNSVSISRSNSDKQTIELPNGTIGAGVNYLSTETSTTESNVLTDMGFTLQQQ